MSRPSLSRCLLVILLLSICILQSCGVAIRGSGVHVKSSHSRPPDRGYSRSTVQLGVLGYYVWGSPHSQSSSKRGHASSHEYPFLSSRREKYEPVTDISREDLERMPKHYRRIVEAGGNLEDFKEYYLSDMYEEDMNQVAAETRALVDKAMEGERRVKRKATPQREFSV